MISHINFAVEKKAETSKYTYILKRIQTIISDYYQNYLLKTQFSLFNRRLSNSNVFYFLTQNLI